MARSHHTRITDTPRDAIALLKQEHRNVETLFSQFEKADEADQSTLAERVCQLLTVHAQMEEEILYPAAREMLENEKDIELVNEASVEHASVKELIAKIEDMTPDEEIFSATVKVLSEYVKHHVKEEEGELFPRLKKSGLDLKDMGRQLAERKLTLMEDMGIEEHDDPGATRKRATGSRKSGSRARGGRKSSPRGATHSRAARH